MNANPASRRLFFALWPEEAVRAELARLARRLRPELAAQWTRPEHWHITLAFLGAVDEARIGAAIAAAEGVSLAGIELVFDRLEYWRKPRVLCLTPEAACPALEGMAAELSARLAAAGFALERRPFRAHLTLARKAAAAPVAGPLEPSIAWRSAAFALVESRQERAGTRYADLRAWALPGPGE